MRPSLKIPAALAGLTLAASPVFGAQIAVSSYSYGANAESQPQPTNFQSGLISDVGNLKLTDGQLSTAGWNDNTNVGFRNDSDNGNPQPQITFDLGGLYQVDVVDVWGNSDFLTNNESMTVASSTDGVSFSAPVVIGTPIFQTGGFANAKLRQESVNTSSLPAGQFYRLEFFDPGQWMMINEVQFDGTPVPEPGSALLAALGALALFRRRRG